LATRRHSLGITSVDFISVLSSNGRVVPTRTAHDKGPTNEDSTNDHDSGREWTASRFTVCSRCWPNLPPLLCVSAPAAARSLQRHVVRTQVRILSVTVPRSLFTINVPSTMFWLCSGSSHHTITILPTTQSRYPCARNARLRSLSGHHLVGQAFGHVDWFRTRDKQALSPKSNWHALSSFQSLVNFLRRRHTGGEPFRGRTIWHRGWVRPARRRGAQLHGYITPEQGSSPSKNR
jgi:hypothetical protein